MGLRARAERLPEPPRGRGSGRWVAPFRAGLAAALGIALLIWALPWITGVDWRVVGEALTNVTLTELAGLTLLWILGLLAHSYVLTGALPGLSRRRALTLGLTGSAVANLTPLGGALGVALNLVMTRAWNVRRSAFAAFTLVTNIWDVVAKLVLPLLAVLGLLSAHELGGTAMRATAIGAVVTLGVTVLGTVAILAHDGIAAWCSRAGARLAHRVAPRRVPSVSGAVEAILHSRDEARTLIAGGWVQLSVGMAAYVALQGVLLWACLHVVGAELAPYAVLAGFAVERLLTLAAITPGSTGIAEGGVAATLIALGGDPVSVAAGVLLYRGFIFLLEIPVGGIWLGGWFLVRMRHQGSPA